MYKNNSALTFHLDRGINDLRKGMCLRKSEVSDERISVCYVIEKLLEHDIHCLPCSYTKDIIDLLM